MIRKRRVLGLVASLLACLVLSACVGGAVDKSTLEREIARAESLKASTPEGERIGHAPGAAHAALQSAIDAAKEVASGEAPDQSALRTAYDDLRKAMDNFRKAIVQAIPLYEDFSAPNADVFFSAAYKSLPTDPSQPLYVRTGGTVIVNNGTITLQGGRFTIGMPADRAPTSSSDSDPGGTLNLTRPYRITIEVVDTAKGEGNARFHVYVDNNTTSAGNSIHNRVGSTASRIYSEDVGNIKPGQVIVIDSDLGTSNSFLQIRAESAATITIKSIKVEYR